eukprot:4930964-Amphidinium_carterae.1
MVKYNYNYCPEKVCCSNGVFGSVWRVSAAQIPYFAAFVGEVELRFNPHPSSPSPTVAPWGGAKVLR